MLDHLAPVIHGAIQPDGVLYHHGVAESSNGALKRCFGLLAPEGRREQPGRSVAQSLLGIPALYLFESRAENESQKEDADSQPDLGRDIQSDRNALRPRSLRRRLD
jgi:hypothetical protein